MAVWEMKAESTVEKSLGYEANICSYSSLEAHLPVLFLPNGDSEVRPLKPNESLITILALLIFSILNNIVHIAISIEWPLVSFIGANLTFSISSQFHLDFAFCLFLEFQLASKGK